MVPSHLPAMSADLPRYRFLEEAGLRVLLLDFSGITDVPKGLAEVERARAFVAQQVADGTHLFLTDVRRTRYDREIVEAFKHLTVHNRPYAKASAVVSDSAIHRAAIAMIALFSRRKIEVFSSREEALAWLGAQR